MKLYKADTIPAGFSLVEVTLSLVIIIILAVVSIPIFFSQQHKSDLDTAIDTVAQHLRRAQVLSQSMKDDSSWGLHIEQGSVIVFQGTSYGSRNAAYDEKSAIATSIAPSGLSNIIFSKLTGVPQVVGVITLTTQDNQQRFLTINSRGMIAYD